MKNLKRILAIATSMTMAIAMVAGVTPMTVKAIDNVNEQQAMEYYGFQKITSFAGLQAGQIIYYTTEDLGAGDVMAQMPQGTGVLEITAQVNNVRECVSQYNENLPAGNDALPGLTVNVTTSATDFDGCSNGVLWFVGGKKLDGFEKQERRPVRLNIEQNFEGN